MRFISEVAASALVTHELAFAAAHEAMVALCDVGTTSFPVVLAHGSSEANRFTVKAAATSELAGLKVGSYWPGNLDRGLARHSSTILLLDQQTGRVTAVIEAGVVNAYRAATVDAVAADLLALPAASKLAIFGAGRQARYECAALARIRPLETILVVARDAGQGATMVTELRRQGLPASVSHARVACERADIIVTATSACSPLFEAGWVRPGTHVASMGSDATGKQELPAALFGRARLFCDLAAQSRRVGEFQHADADLSLTELGDVIMGRQPGRLSTDDVTVFDSSGLSVQDFCMARALLLAVSKRVFS